MIIDENDDEYLAKQRPEEIWIKEDKTKPSEINPKNPNPDLSDR